MFFRSLRDCVVGCKLVIVFGFLLSNFCSPLIPKFVRQIDETVRDVEHIALLAWGLLPTVSNLTCGGGVGI